MEECTKESCCKKKNSITEDDVEKAIEAESYGTLGVKTTYCLLTLKNGFEVIGTSACVDPTNYSLDVGKIYSKKKALEKVWEHLASILQQELAAKEESMEEPAPPEDGGSLAA